RPSHKIVGFKQTLFVLDTGSVALRIDIESVGRIVSVADEGGCLIRQVIGLLHRHGLRSNQLRRAADDVATNSASASASGLRVDGGCGYTCAGHGGVSIVRDEPRERAHIKKISRTAGAVRDGGGDGGNLRGVTDRIPIERPDSGWHHSGVIAEP